MLTDAEHSLDQSELRLGEICATINTLRQDNALHKLQRESLADKLLLVVHMLPSHESGDLICNEVERQRLMLIRMTETIKTTKQRASLLAAQTEELVQEIRELEHSIHFLRVSLQRSPLSSSVRHA